MENMQANIDKWGMEKSSCRAVFIPLQWEDVGHDGQIGFPVHIVQLVANTCSYKKARLRDITRAVQHLF